MPEEYMTMEEAIRELGVSEDEIKKLITEGKLRSFRDGTLIPSSSFGHQISTH